LIAKTDCRKRFFGLREERILKIFFEKDTGAVLITTRKIVELEKTPNVKIDGNRMSFSKFEMFKNLLNFTTTSDFIKNLLVSMHFQKRACRCVRRKG